MSTLATLLERPDLENKHRVKLEKMQGMTLSPAMQFSITRIAQKYKTKAPVSAVKTEENRSEKKNKIKCLEFFAVSFYDLLEIANNEEQEIIRAIFQKNKKERQERVNKISLNDMKLYHVTNPQNSERLLSIVSKYYYEEEKERKPPMVEDWQELVAEIIEMQLTYFNEISKPEKPDRLNKFEKLLWEYNLAMKEEDEEEDEKDERSPVTSHQSPTTNNQQPTIDKRNAKIDWSQS